MRFLHYILPFSFGVLQDYVIADPTAEEESLMSAAVTILASTDGRLCGVNKPGGSPVPLEKLKECMELASLAFRNL